MDITNISMRKEICMELKKYFEVLLCCDFGWAEPIPLACDRGSK